MAKLVAIEWDTNEARVVIGRSRGKDLVIDQAFAVALQSTDEGQVGPQLAAALTAHGLGKTEALVGVGRTSIELRRMQLPPAPDAELPDMVRLQAMRQFTTMGEDWPLDFIPVATTPTSIDVLAAAISPQLVRQMTEVCAASDLSPKRLVLRPFAAASLLMRARSGDSRVRLVMDVLASDADLFVLADDTVAFMRTVRLPAVEAGESVRGAALLSEVRRTIAAAQSQLGGRRIEAILAFGSQARHRELMELFQKQLDLPFECIDPFAIVESSRELAAAPPETPGRYAPLLGMLLDEIHDSKHSIDFLHPRKRPEIKSPRERYLAYTAGVIAAVCLLAMTIKFQLNRKDQELARLNQELKSATTNVEAVKKRELHLKQVELFADSRIGWLDELHHLSQHFPDARNAIVTQLVATVQADGEGRITLDGMVLTPEQVEAMERSLRDERHRVVGRGASQDPTGKDYSWRFNESIAIDPKVAPPQPAAGPAAEPPAEPPVAPPSPSDQNFTAENSDGSPS